MLIQWYIRFTVWSRLLDSKRSLLALPPLEKLRLGFLSSFCETWETLFLATTFTHLYRIAEARRRRVSVIRIERDHPAARILRNDAHVSHLVQFGHANGDHKPTLVHLAEFKQRKFVPRDLLQEHHDLRADKLRIWSTNVSVRYQDTFVTYFTAVQLRNCVLCVRQRRYFDTGGEITVRLHKYRNMTDLKC